MAATPPRKFTILDGMILVAAIACGFALWRAVQESLGGLWVFMGESWLRRNTRGLSWAATPFLMILAPAVLAMRLRRPRPRWIRLARQPGMVACCAALVPIAVSLARFARGGAIQGREELNPMSLFGPGFYLQYRGYDTGLWVLGAWLALALSGRRRAERSWIDRLGRIVGIGWLVVLVIDILDPML